jgi:hypothetical protein
VKYINIVTWRLKAGMVEQTSTARQWLGNHVSAAMNINKNYLPLQRIAANESLLGSMSLNKVISVTTQKNNNGTLENGDFYPGRMAVIKGSAFINSSSRDQFEIGERAVRDSLYRSPRQTSFKAARDSSWRFVRQTFRKSSVCELLQSTVNCKEVLINTIIKSRTHYY